MSLRTRLLLMFAALAVAPLLGVGVFDYVWSSRTLEAHVAAQDSLLAARAAEALHDRVAIQASDLSFLAQNVETRRLLLALGGAGDEPLTAVRADVEPWLLEVWLRFQPSYHAIELRDAGDRTVLRFGEPPEAGAGRDEAMTASRPVPDPDAEPLGKIVAWPRIDELLPSEALEARFGVSGYSVVVDRAARRVLHHPRASRTRQPWSELAADGLVLDSARMDASSGRFAFRAGDTLRVAAFASLQSPPWTVVATSAVDEFAAPFRRMRIVNLGLVLAVLVSVSIASVWLVRRSTRPLEALTAAADRVAHGEMEPTLPPAGPDEPGRLAAAFDTMLRRIREMIAELERSRQMAAVGGGRTSVLTPPEAGPTWFYSLSPDGRFVAYPDPKVRGAALWTLDLQGIVPDREGG